MSNSGPLVGIRAGRPTGASPGLRGGSRTRTRRSCPLRSTRLRGASLIGGLQHLEQNSHVHEIGEVARLHLLHDPLAVMLHRPWAEVEH
jgi:hypothetical protein